MTPEQFAAVAAQALRAGRYRLSSETALQDSLKEMLELLKFPFEREKALGPKDRPDFLLAAGSVVLEVKLKCPKKTIWRQLERYAEHEQVKALILVSATPMGLPPAINGKPVHFVSTGMGWIGC